MSVRLLFLDLETTGLDFDKDFITEIGYVVKDSEIAKPLLTIGEMIRLEEGVEVPEFITKLTGITTGMLTEFGTQPKSAYANLLRCIKDFKVDFIVAHNGNGFDKPMLEANLKREGLELPDIDWLDTRSDIVYPEHFKMGNLTYLCAEHGFINPFPHAALFDAMATAKLFSFYKAEEVVAYMREPSVVVRAMVTYEQRDLAKNMGFSWQQIEDKVYNKQWVKKIKESGLKDFTNECEFKVVVIA